jgi:hypothetical protein
VQRILPESELHHSASLFLLSALPFVRFVFVLPIRLTEGKYEYEGDLSLILPQEERGKGATNTS